MVHPRLSEEWHDIETVYPGARHREQPERIEVDLSLEDGLYIHTTTEAAILVPPGYRATGPDGFLVPGDLRFADGSQLPGGDAAGAGMPGWFLVSFHLQDEQGRPTWSPTADPRRGDNVVSYLQSVESFLARRCN